MKILDLHPPIEQKIMVKEYQAFLRALELAPPSFCSAERDRIASSFPCLFVFLLSVWQEEALYFFTCRGERSRGGAGDSSNDSKKHGLLKSYIRHCEAEKCCFNYCVVLFYATILSRNAKSRRMTHPMQFY
jgi:hypothetical protein